MKATPVYLSDLQLLHQLFCSEKEFSVYDPQHRITGIKPLLNFNLSNNEVCFNISANGAGNFNKIDFYFGTETKKDFRLFHYVNNPDGTLRWIIPSDAQSATFITLYNSQSVKATLYKFIARTAFSLGCKKYLMSGSFLMKPDLITNVKTKYGIKENEQFTLFTGTRGENRKIILEINDGDHTTHFIKISFSDKAKKNLQNEIDMLTTLNKYDYTSLSMPHVEEGRVKGTARLSNIKPGIVIPAQRITEIHLKALAELYNVHHEEKIILETAAWQTIENNLQWMYNEHPLINNMDEFKTRRIIHLLGKLSTSLPVDMEIPVSVSHGDFTPWNMYMDSKRLYVYDWELAKNGIPMLFDLFHFVFQSQVLLLRKDFSEIKESIKQVMQSPTAQSISHKYSINTNMHYKLYLLFNISYYMRIYMNEKQLLTQSHWMIDVWLDALQDITAN